VTLVLTLLEHAFRVASVLLFPAIALWAWRAAGPARLWAVTGIGLGLIILLAAFVASPIGGNALAPTYGYGHTAPRSLLLHGLMLGLPLVAAAGAVQALARRVSSRLALYAIGVFCAGAAWVAGVLAAVRILAAVS
jgi:hypothetical protein